MKNRLRGVIFPVLALAIAVDWAFPSSPEAIVPDEMDTFLKGVMGKAHIPGFAVCLMKNNEISNYRAWGNSIYHLQ